MHASQNTTISHDLHCWLYVSSVGNLMSSSYCSNRFSRNTQCPEYGVIQSAILSNHTALGVRAWDFLWWCCHLILKIDTSDLWDAYILIDLQNDEWPFAAWTRKWLILTAIMGDRWTSTCHNFDSHYFTLNFHWRKETKIVELKRVRIWFPCRSAPDLRYDLLVPILSDLSPTSVQFQFQSLPLLEQSWSSTFSI